MTQSFYDLLGVSSDADAEEIERAYRQRIKETHPDVNDDPDASERTARLVEARDVLTDDAERARYDRLGHAAYVGDGPDPGAADPGSGGADPGDDGRSGTSSAGSASDRNDAEERRRRERRARQHVDFGADGTASGARSSASSATDSSTASGTTSSAATGSGAGSTPNATGAGGGASAGGANEPPSWSDTSDGWAARTPTRGPPGLVTQVFDAVADAPATAGVTFALYPLLVLGAFLPAFPLVVNVVVGACLLAMVGAAQSPPGLGVAVYGSWSVLGAVGLVVAGTSPLSPVGLVVLGTTWLPLGFSLLTYAVLDA